MAALRSGRPCFLAAVACLAVLADRNVDSNATHEDGDASYAKAALGAHLSFAKFNRSAGDAAPAAAGSNLPAGASANVAVATAAAFEPVKIEDSEKPDKVVKVEDADAVGQAGRGATAHGEMEHPEEQSPAMKAVIAAQEDLGSDEGSRELAMAAAATAKVLHEAPKDEFLAESMGTSTQGNDLRRRRTAYPSNPGTYPGKAKEPTATPEITHRRGAPLPTSVDLQVQKLRRVAVEAKRSRDAAAQMILGQLAQPVEPRGGDARHRSMPLRHPHGVNPTMLASSGAGVSRGSTSAKTASTLELHAIQALAANRSAVQLHASKELPIFASAEQAPAPAPASPAANSSNTIALDNHSAVQLAEQDPPLEPPPGGSGVVSSQALDEATKAQPAEPGNEVPMVAEEQGSTAGQYMKGFAISTFLVGGVGGLIMGVVVIVKKASGRRPSGAGQQR